MSLRAHGPENAEFELKKAYAVVVEGELPYFWQNREIPGVNPSEAGALYKHAYNSYRRGNRLAAERWARAAKHLSRAFTAESRIAYLEAHATGLPFLESGSAEDPEVHERSGTTDDLLNSVAEHVPAGFDQMPQAMSRYLARGRAHLAQIARTTAPQELLRAERIRAAYEYGRVLEIMALAYEAEAPRGKTA
jgi:hypothetical protein